MMKLPKFWSRTSSNKSDSSFSTLSGKSRSPMASSSSSASSAPSQRHPEAPSRSQSAEIYSSDSSSGPFTSDSLLPIPKHIQELHDAFRYFDSDGDGKISVAELGKVLRLLGESPSDDDLNAMVKEADSDGDGFVCLEEFVSLNTRGVDKSSGVLASVDELRAVFGVFDTDRNGYISAEELHGVLLRLGERECTMEDCIRMIGGVDADGDGRVDFEEFKRMMSTSVDV